MKFLSIIFLTLSFNSFAKCKKQNTINCFNIYVNSINKKISKGKCIVSALVGEEDKQVLLDKCLKPNKVYFGSVIQVSDMDKNLACGLKFVKEASVDQCLKKYKLGKYSK